MHKINYRIDDNFIGMGDKIIQMKNLSDYYNFVISDDFSMLIEYLIVILKRKRRFDNIDLTLLFESAGLTNSNNVKLDNSLLSFEKLLFSSIIHKVKIMVGNKLLQNNTFADYNDILKFELVFSSIIDFYYDRHLINFTIQQYEESVSIRSDFDKNIKAFKEYLNEI